MRNLLLGETLTFSQVKEFMLHTKPIAQASGSIQRKLIVTPIRNAYGNIGTVVFSIEGTPPKGYAMYNPETKTLNILNESHKTIKKFYEVYLEIPQSEVIL